MKDVETCLYLLEEIRGIRERVDKIEAILNAEVEKASGKNGIAMTELLDLRTPHRRIVLELTKTGTVSSAELSEKLGMEEETMRGMVETLVEKGYITETMEEGEKKYEVSIARKTQKKVPLDIWSALEKKVGR
jgi:DNA-binding MarR family transcriptional regulator